MSALRRKPAGENSILDRTLAKSNARLVDLFETTTSFKERNLLPLSIVMSCPYLSEPLIFYKENLKHVKGKFRKGIIEMAKINGSAIQESKLSKLLLFRRKEGIL